MGQFVGEIYYRILYDRTHSITETYSTTEYACVRLRFSARSVLSIVQKRPIYSTKETYLRTQCTQGCRISVKRVPVYMSKETHLHVKRDPLTCQKRLLMPVPHCPGNRYRITVKRDPFTCQKRPFHMSKETLSHVKGCTECWQKRPLMPLAQCPGNRYRVTAIG